jgi:hypothetical protein
MTRLSSRDRSVSPNRLAVDKHDFDAGSGLLWLLKGGLVPYRSRVEDNQIRVSAFMDRTAIFEPKLRRGQTRHSPYRFLERDNAELSGIVAKNTGESSP